MGNMEYWKQDCRHFSKGTFDVSIAKQMPHYQNAKIMKEYICVLGKNDENGPICKDCDKYHR